VVKIVFTIFWIIKWAFTYIKGSGGLVVKLSASQDHGLEPYLGHDHFSLYDTTITGWFQEADSESYYYKLQELVSQTSLNKYV
jgi:hypothetical protein